jgi:hypothetical protein
MIVNCDTRIHITGIVFMGCFGHTAGAFRIHFHPHKWKSSLFQPLSWLLGKIARWELKGVFSTRPLLYKILWALHKLGLQQPDVLLYSTTLHYTHNRTLHNKASLTRAPIRVNCLQFEWNFPNGPKIKVSIWVLASPYKRSIHMKQFKR